MMRSGEARPEMPDPRPTVQGSMDFRTKGGEPEGSLIERVLTEETSSCEHMDIHRETLKDTGDDNNQASEEDRPFTTTIIGAVWCQDKTCKAR